MSVCTFLSTALLFFTPRKHHSAHLLSVVTFKFSLKHYFLLCYFYENFRVFFSPPIYFTSTTLVVFLDSGSLYFFFLITIKFQKWEKKKKRTICFTAARMIPLILHCRKKCLDIFSHILRTAKSLTFVVMYGVVTFTLDDSNSERLSMRLQNHVCKATVLLYSHTEVYASNAFTYRRRQAF